MNTELDIIDKNISSAIMYRTKSVSRFRLI